MAEVGAMRFRRMTIRRWMIVVAAMSLLMDGIAG
jgi:hypothetical protein